MKGFLKKSGLKSVVLVSLAAIAFLPKNVAQWIVLGAILLFGASQGIAYFLDHKDEISEKREKMKSEKKDKSEKKKAPSEIELALNYVVVQLSHRVTDKLHSMFPEATWRWVDKPSLKTFSEGGRLRITTSKTDTFTEADVILDVYGRIEVNMLNSDSITSLVKKVDGNADTDYTVDADAWYSQCGQKLLTDIITELNAGGTKVLCINEDGSIVVDDNTKVGTFKTFPSKNLWKKLISIFEENGLSAVENEHSIQVGW